MNSQGWSGGGGTYSYFVDPRCPDTNVGSQYDRDGSRTTDSDFPNAYNWGKYYYGFTGWCGYDFAQDIMSIPTWLDIASPTTGPRPLTKLNTPAGILDSSISSANIIDDNGANSDGFKTIVQPDAIAGITFKQTWFIGQFQGVINAQTPFGS